MHYAWITYLQPKRFYWFASKSEVNYYNCVCAKGKKSQQKHETENFSDLTTIPLWDIWWDVTGEQPNGLCAVLCGIELLRFQAWRVVCDVFLCKTLYLRSSSLYQGLQIGTSNLLGVNFKWCQCKFYLLTKKGVMLINSLVYVRASRRIELEFWVLVFVEEGKLVKQGQNNIETRTRINSKSTQVGRRVQESNPGHIDGMLTVS